MNRDQLSTFNPNNLSGNHPSDLNAIFLQPVAPAAKISARQQVLDRILDKISAEGMSSLTNEERDTLDHVSRRHRSN